MSKAKKEITRILIETGIKLLTTAQDLNEKDQLFSNSDKPKLKKGDKNVNTKNSRPSVKKSTAVSG